MTRLLLAASAAAVALTAMPAQARHITGPMTCARWRHGHCLAWRPRYAVGYRFGPTYDYVDVAGIPEPIVTRYRLRPNFRYVRENGFVYVVNPNTYRVVRVITVP